ncbi:class A beta-lactamase [Amycolatopsis sp. PS_44_ISF1]|uniref:class A beta-lactamase n=1 Tax=Amycolatopsis sp. PS_44_ISF1 TaxID=2974917 RepID=UPI0028DF7ED8|nr:class A beta-lactamase [Amycolatopsis sp. PS_44_ISF1]MDT8912910.1 class A beta-lactamase [Amycolatopsis sp. PS_44_ISF1]
MSRGMLSRRGVLAAGLGLVAAGCAGKTAAAAPSSPSRAPRPDVRPELAALERQFGGRLGVSAIDTGSGATAGYREDERFLLCSTHKVLAASALLRTRPEALAKVIHYDRSQLVDYSPVTSLHVADGMTGAALCEAAITVSDNTAANLIVGEVGGPPAVTAFVRTLGDPLTRMDRIEPDINVGAPGDERDTTTPARMVGDLRALVLGQGLDPADRDRLTGWMVANTTGGKQVRAGVPAGWRVADKTGSGAKGESNDIAVVWPTGRAPWVIAVYTAPSDPKSTAGAATIAEATRIIVKAFG